MMCEVTNTISLFMQMVLNVNIPSPPHDVLSEPSEIWYVFAVMSQTFTMSYIQSCGWFPDENIQNQMTPDFYLVSASPTL